MIVLPLHWPLTFQLYHSPEATWLVMIMLLVELEMLMPMLE